MQFCSPPSVARRRRRKPADSEGATFSPGALDLAVELTEGYPYFIQELGYAVWGVAGGPCPQAAIAVHALCTLAVRGAPRAQSCGSKLAKKVVRRRGQ